VTIEQSPVRSGKRVHFVIPPEVLTAAAPSISPDHQDNADPPKGSIPRPRARSYGDASSCGLLSMLIIAIMALLLVVAVLLLGLLCKRALANAVTRGIAAIVGGTLQESTGHR
jgi:hypothetical protein